MNRSMAARAAVEAVVQATQIVDPKALEANHHLNQQQTSNKPAFKGAFAFLN